MKIHHRIGMVTLALAGLVLVQCESSAADQASATVPTHRLDLFNGKDFTGWTFCMVSNSPPDRTWSVAKGIIHCSGQPYGYIRTKENYRDYKLTVEWRFVKVAPNADNSGVFVHVKPPDQVWPAGIECQGMYKNQGDFIFLGDFTCRELQGTSSRRLAKHGPSNEKAAGEWNTYQITCAGNGVKVYVNGKLMNEATDCTVSDGAIAIQSEGGELEVRKVVLEPLASH